MHRTEIQVKVKKESKVKDGLNKVKQKVDNAIENRKKDKDKKEEPSKTTTTTTTTTPTKNSSDDAHPALINQLILKLSGLVPTVDMLKQKKQALREAIRSSTGKIPESEEILLHKFKKQGRKFEDEEFPPSAKILGPGAPSGIQWKRVTELAPNAALFVDGFHPGDVVQGTLGDCWFLGSIAVLAVFSKLFLRVFTRTAINPDGSYSFRFWRQGKWEIVTIDDRIPCKDGKPIYSRCRDDNEMWLCLIEKAYAKFWGSYANLEGGHLTQALAELTGGVTNKFHLPSMRAEVSSGEFWKTLLGLKKSGCLLGCSFHSNDQNFKNGLIPNHAYSLFKIKQFGQHKLLQIRNPWGRGEWKGRWSDGSDLWTPELKKAVRFVSADDGYFYMCYEDFTAIFDTVYVCQPIPEEQRLSAKGEWKGPSAAGSLNHPNWRYNPQFLLEIKKSTTVTCLLEQVQPSVPLRSRKLHPVGCYVFRTQGNPQHRLSSDAGDFLNKDLSYSEVPQFKSVLELKSEDGPFVIIPTTYTPNLAASFSISVCGSSLKSLTAFPPESLGSISSSWTRNTCGGCSNHQTWKNNPKFTVKFANTSKTNFTVAIVDVKKTTHGAIGVYVFDNPQFDGNPLATSSFTPGEATISFSLPKARSEFFVIATTFEKNVLGNFELFVCSNDVSSISINPL